MSKIKYRFNTHSLTYEKVGFSWRKIVLKVLSYLAIGTVFAGVTVFIAFTYFDSPKEKMQKREIAWMSYQYDILNKKLSEVQTVLGDLEKRDDNIYRMIFEADPIADEIRKAGFGGVDRYKELEGYENSRLIVESTKKLDQVSKQLYIQSKSFDEVIKMAEKKEFMLSSIPAIQPISNKDLKHEPSGYGMRMHPIYKYSKFHAGMDFTANIGTKIYATGDGVVSTAEYGSGYGNHVVINHGYGYQTLYGHMEKIAVLSGHKVKRGELIGYVGNTGLSAGPHVHYEVQKNGNPVNPVNFYYNDLTPAEYKQMIEVSSRASQSFD
ncbi:MAG: M23 family metallopeptidase [Bacteroidetes bacterium]|nr:MAG: M23 family metallopeptidase [Bacteroidota bacterium]